MKYKTFGKTGLEISRVALGTWGMGGVGWDNYDEETKTDAIAAAIESGINLIDSAPAYNGGEAERFVGRALEKLGARDKVYISTKCGNRFVNGTTYVRDGSYDFIQQQCEDSLANLRTDHIDIYLVHWPDPNTPFEETFRSLEDLKKAGKILHYGVSNFTVEQMEEIAPYSNVEAYQPPYSMVDRSQEDRILYADSKDMGIMTYGSLGGGILTGRFRSLTEFDAVDSRNRFYKHFKEPMFSKVMELLGVMDGISAKTGLPLSQIALLWSAQKEFVDTCLVGAQKRARVLENAGAFDHELSAEDLAVLDEAVAKLV